MVGSADASDNGEAWIGSGVFLNRRARVPTVDLVIPVFNEEAALPRLFEALEPLTAAGIIRRIVIGDNGSTDRSAALATERGAVVVCEPHRGYGAACLAAIAAIRDADRDTGKAVPLPDAVAFLDADLSDDPAQLPRLIEALETHDLVIGSRPKLAEPGSLTATQRFGSRVASLILRVLTGHRYRDLGPMRAIGWEALERLGMQDRTWGWTVEMQAKAAMSGLRILEIDVPYRRRTAGHSKISGTIIGSARAGWKIVVTAFVIRLTWQPARDGR
ncbi:MAG: glycosyltransferase family 2 protein [Planctomycetes bacterium]|nr:glycosyltransferase family 2 protein [Planctomycetota bacterium]NOG54715.1 glycosyltransferase family 2 protein [Planctomycetota bacterium]